MSVALPILSLESPKRPPVAPAAARVEGRLYDSHGRVVRDLRLSITDRCNYRCVYCMDPDFRYMPKHQLLEFDEYVTVVRVAVGLGIEKVRITGGEPTLHPQLDRMIETLARLPIDDLAMTSNGSLFKDANTRRWREAGLHRITLSLDSLRPERVARITRTRSTARTVIEAIGHAREAGLEPIKVNAVVMAGVNDDELADFADFACEHEIDMRLIEFMPLDSSRSWDRKSVVSADDMLTAIRKRHQLVPEDGEDPASTSLNFRFTNGSRGRIGIIAPVTRVFCGACSRMRLTADGRIRPCLFSHQEWDLRSVLRSGASDEAVGQFLIDAMWTKKAGHGIGTKSFVAPARTMSAIGG